jgi:hypothetical protein
MYKLLPPPTKILYPYVIAIPTYRREKIIIQKTLQTLFYHKIDASLITLFLANVDEYNRYVEYFINVKSLNPQLDVNYYKFIESLNMVIGNLGLKAQRNFISDYYLDNQYIVELDDDIEGIKMLVIDKNDKKNRKKWTLIDIPKLDNMIKQAFKMCKELNAYIWGIYPIANAYFMSPIVSTSLKFIVGPMFGIINRKDDTLKLSIDEKENVERTLQYYTKDGIVLRFNNITVNTKYYTNPGGMQTNKGAKAQRMTNALTSAKYLHNNYPDLTTIFYRTKTKRPEIKLINKTLHKKNKQVFNIQKPKRTKKPKKM